MVSLYVLKRVCDQEAVKRLWRSVIRSTHPGSLMCPVCDRPMFALPLTGKSVEFEVDA